MPMSAQDIGAKPFGDETCKLGATNDGAELRVQILKSYLQDIFVKFFLKRLKKFSLRSRFLFLAWIGPNRV